MGFSDLAAIAEILYPIAAAEATRGLDADHLRRRYQILPLDTRQQLLTLANSVGSNWEPGRAFGQWEQHLADPRNPVSPMADEAAAGDEPPEAVELADTLSLVTAAALDIDGPTFTRRLEQIALAKNIASAIEEQSQIVVEAGTGIGKTLAYLAPLAIWGIISREVGIVSTHTKVLQEQILEQEVPFLRQLLNRYRTGWGDRLRVEVVKGRNNYLCLGALTKACTDATTMLEASFLARIAVWGSFTKTGDRAELSLTDEEEERFFLISAANSRCSLRQCRWFRRDRCFLSRLKRRAAGAHIVVTNHALLVVERQMKDLLPKRAWSLVIDEAHSLEDAATSILSVDMPRERLATALRRAYRSGSRRDYGIVTERTDLAWDLKQELRALVIETQGAADHWYDAIGEFYRSQPEIVKRKTEFVRLSGGKRALAGWRRVIEHWLLVMANLESVCESLVELEMHYLGEAVDDLDEREQLVELSGEVRLAIQVLQSRVTDLDDAIRDPSGDVISWLQSAAAGDVRVSSAPLSVAGALKSVWREHKSVTLTSASLATDQGFDFLRKRIGFQATNEVRYMSPFDLPNRTRLFVLTDMPEGSTSGYNDAVAQAVVDLTTATNGRSMVLFTSHTAMRQAANAVRPQLEQVGIRLFVQRQDGLPADVVDALRQEDRAVAFGVASMWSGVDVPGDSLSQLIIARLPFPFTKHPIHEARAECYNSGFSEFTLPLTVLQFRQGFGRLMRKETDRGVVVVLDGRMESKGYGRAFVESVYPPHGEASAWVQRATVAEAVRDIPAFLDSVPIAT